MSQSADNAAKNKPKILIFSLAYLPLVGGAELALREITDRLGDIFNFDLITRRFDKTWPILESVGKVNVYRIGQGSGSYFGQKLGKIIFVFRAYFLASKLHRLNHYQTTWAIMAAYGGWSALLFKLRYKKVKFLLTLQEGDSEKYILSRVGIFYPLWRLIFKKADYIQAISNYLADFARRHGAKCAITVVPNGVNADAFNAIQKIRKHPNDPKIIITTSRLVHKNGVDILIRAVAELKAKSYKLKAMILGSGPEEQNLKKLAKNLDLLNDVIFVGHVEPDQIPQYLSKADVFVRPSRSEGLGNSFLEAMAAGLPVIGTAVGGIPDFLKDEVTGLFCKTEDHNDLAEKIKLLLSDVGLSEKLSKNGRELVIANYSWQGISKRMGELLKSQVFDIRLLVATGIYPPDIGGPATYASLLVKELPQRGVGVQVVTYGPAGISRKIPKGIRHLVYFFICFKTALKSDLILAQDTISAGLPALLAAKLSGRKFVIRVPGDYVWEQATQRFGVKDSIDDFQNKKYGWRVEFLRSIQKFVVNSADIVIAPSTYFGNLVAKWVKNPSKINVIYNGIDLPTNYKLQAISRDKVIVSVGRLVPWKGFDFLIELMRDLPDWKLIIIGSGPQENELKARSYKLKANVEFTGSMSREKVLGYLSKSELFVLNTSFESFSFQVVEAMSLGLPIITTNIGNLLEIIENGVDGILVEPNNKKQFLDAIIKLDQDEYFRKSISEKARIKAEKFSIENTISELIKLLF